MTGPATHPGDDISRGSSESRQRARAGLLRILGPFFDRTWRDPAAIPLTLPQGPALFVANHSGGCLAMLEPMLLAHRLQNPVHFPRLLLHEVMWRSPLSARLRDLGALRASPENANRLLSQGESVLVYPGGDVEPFRSFRARDHIALGDRHGYLKLALRHGVPIVPIVTSGVQSGFISLSDGRALAARLPLARRLRVGVLPITMSFPFGLSVGIPAPYIPLATEVSIRVLPALRFSGGGEDPSRNDAFVAACHAEVTRVMQRALDGLANTRREARRRALHRRLDQLVDGIEQLTNAPHSKAIQTIAPAHALFIEQSHTERTPTPHEAPAPHRPSLSRRSGMHLRRRAE